jgi:hypothetical protein
MLELSPPLPILLLLRVGGLSRLNTRAVAAEAQNAAQRSAVFTIAVREFMKPTFDTAEVKATEVHFCDEIFQVSVAKPGFITK